MHELENLSVCVDGVDCNVVRLEISSSHQLTKPKRFIIIIIIIIKTIRTKPAESPPFRV
jgi:hypothetical protein